MHSEKSILDKIPQHLKPFIIDQHYEKYTAKDQAVWRYVMRNNVHYLKEVAHESYTEGLKKTGISVDRIPRIEEMNAILQKIGWAAVCVDGFIPPGAFMEYQAYQTLVIAADIRTAEHIEYTPAPDIIHEAAGHAPIIANPEYAEYLRRFGEIGSKAISSAKDYELYEAIRHLSIIKENPKTSEKQIAAAEAQIEAISENMGEPSEMARIRNLHWWTVEYGLIGSMENPKIYGAGLLSSIGESKWCMSDAVKKVPYSIAAADVNFDITKPQPQLFVTPDFAYLSYVLEEFANKMALRKGGLKGIQKLIESKNLGTVELSTGIQISGIFTEVLTDEEQRPVYIKTKGPTALAFKNNELIGHDKTYHGDGFGSPVGKLKGINLAIEDMSPTDLEVYGIYEGRTTKLEFEGGITVEGTIITGKRNLQGKIILISFKNCLVKRGEELLFHPDWGIFDMVVGKDIISAYAGVADPDSFGMQFNVPDETTHKITYSASEKAIHQLYAEVAGLRNDTSGKLNAKKLENSFNKLSGLTDSEWLLALEIYEQAVLHGFQHISKKADVYLKKCASNPEINQLIQNGKSCIKPVKVA